MILTIGSGELTAEISNTGAELVRLKDVGGRDYLWNGDPAYWKGRAPLLFPIVGRAVGDQIHVEGRSYPMRQHGFARTSRFDVVEIRPTHCILELSANSSTLAQYPFLFRLEVSFRVVGRTISLSARLFNNGQKDLPASFGFHPALRWPLPDAVERSNHVLRFDQDEPAPIRVLANGLLSDQTRPSPVHDRRLELSDELFEHDALIFDQLRSRSVEYIGPTRQKLRVDFPDMPHLGIWTKPGAGFVCIEPWQGYASPVGSDGQFAKKPGIVHVRPQTNHLFEMSIEVGA